MLLLLQAYSSYLEMRESRKSSGETAPISGILGDISDLYIQVGEKMKFRVPGGLHEFGDAVTQTEFDDTFNFITNLAEALAAKGRVEDAYDLITEFQSSEGNLVQTSTRVRCTVYKYARATKLGAVVRFAPDRPEALKDLHLDPLARSLLDDLRGAILVTGPTHSGKTYTMASMMDFVNSTQRGHIVTIEDPIELPIPPQNCVVSQIEIGRDAPTFAEGITGSLRQSPLAVMVGEIRDPATAQAALRVAQGGHFLLAGLHGPDAVGAMRAFCSFLDQSRRDEERAQLAQRLNGVIYQVLVPSVDATTYHPACEVISFLKNAALRQKLACGDFDAISAALLNAEVGCKSVNHSLVELINEGKISYGAAKNATYNQLGLHKVAEKAGLLV